MKTTAIFWVGPLSVSLCSGTAFAQAAPDFESSIIQGNQIDEAIRGQEQLEDQVRKDDNEVDGEAGVYVLRKNKIFYVGATAGIAYSENPLRTADDAGDSFSANLAVTAGVQTKIAETFDFGFQATISGTEYFEDFAPSSRNINGSLTVGAPIGDTPFYVNGTIFGGFNFNQSFEQGTEFYGGSLALAAGFPVGKNTVIRPGVGLTRQWSGSSENNSTAAAVSVNAFHTLSPKVSLGANARVTRTWFDDFFEDVSFVARNDWQYGGGLSLNYQHSERLSFTIGGGYEKRDSTFFLSDFESFDASVLVSARMRF